MAGSAKNARPYALISASITTDYTTPTNNTWHSPPWATTLENEGNGILERVGGSNTQFRALTGIHVSLRARYSTSNSGGDRREHNLRVLINGTTVPVGALATNLSMAPEKMMDSYFLAFDMDTNDVVEFQVDDLGNDLTLYALGSYLQIYALDLR